MGALVDKKQASGTQDAVRAVQAKGKDRMQKAIEKQMKHAERRMRNPLRLKVPPLRLTTEVAEAALAGLHALREASRNDEAARLDGALEAVWNAMRPQGQTAS